MMLNTTLETSTEEETIALGRRFAKNLSAGDVVTLRGPLGAGKTCFVKGVAQAFGVDPASVHSPTFALIHEYPGTIPLYHFDCYRMKSPQEALEIGAEEYFYGTGVCVIEWPERIASILPPVIFQVEIEAIAPSKRTFIFKKKPR